jgi:hypothetical protein
MDDDDGEGEDSEDPGRDLDKIQVDGGKKHHNNRF